MEGVFFPGFIWDRSPDSQMGAYTCSVLLVCQRARVRNKDAHGNVFFTTFALSVCFTHSLAGDTAPLAPPVCQKDINGSESL